MIDRRHRPDPLDAVQLAVIAKEPVAGRVKTRLCPPCTPVQAAAVAEASLADTLDAVLATGAPRGTDPVATDGDPVQVARRVLVLDGSPGPWLPDGFDVIPQQGDGLDERLTAAFAACFAARPDAPVILVGMDTPQVTPHHLHRVASQLATHDAVLGPAPDGGYWLIALRHLAADAITGVPMSTTDTYRHQHDRLVRCGYTVAVTEPLTDVDDAADAAAVAATIPGTRFAAAVHAALGAPTPGAHDR